MKHYKKVGRPSVPDDELRKTRSIKATDEEWEQIKTLARQAGLTTSEYIRMCALKARG
jgi:predicted DNA-binding protein